MDLPDFWFSDSPVPPLPGQRAHGHDLNKRSIIPVIKDAVLDRPTDFKSLSIKYPVTAANGNTVMRPLSTCLPFGVPNRLSNLQDLCSSIIPFAIQSQEWIRESRYGAEQTTDSQGDSDKRQLRRSLSGSEAGGANSRLGNGDDNFSDAESSDEDPRSVGQTHGFPKDEETDVLHHDWLLPLSDLPCIPDYRRFKPYQKDIERMEEAAKRAAVYCGFGRVNRLASPLNWWYSGGCLAYFGFEPDSGYLLHPSASLSLLETTPVNVTGKRSFKRIVSSGHKPQDTQLEESIYQIVTQCMETVDSALVGARLSKEVILLQMKNIAAPELTIKRVIKAEHQDYFSHISASPYIQGEFLSASQDGKVSIWSVEREEHICGFDVQHMGFCELAQNHWIGCYFGNYPRSTGVVTSSAVELFDGRLRSQNTAQLELLRKAHYMNGVQDDIVAADLLAANTSYHMILSTKEFLLVDQRFSKRPAIRYPLQCTTPALYLRCAKGSSGAPNCIFAGSQMSQMAMCFELEDALESKPSSLGSLPFCTAAPRQLVPLAQLAGLHVDFSMKQRLEKPIIGIEVIPQGNDLGVTLAMVSSLGDLFMQSYEIVEKEGYDPDGVAAFSAVHPDVQLKKAEAGHLNKWLTAASAAVADPSSRLHLRLFNPDKSSCISEEMSGYLTRCSQAVVRQPHPHCGRCNEVSDIPEDAVVDKNVTCPRCHGPVCASRRRHMNGDGSKRFVFVEEVNDDEPIVLPENFQIAEERLREMALHNRIIHRILTKCYGENIDSSLLEPQANQMTPSMQQKSREESKNVDQVELTKMFLENCEKTVPTNAVVADEQVEGDETDDFQEEVLHGTTFDHGECVDVMHDVGDWLRFDPFATATQQDPLDLNAGTMRMSTEI